MGIDHLGKDMRKVKEDPTEEKEKDIKGTMTANTGICFWC